MAFNQFNWPWLHFNYNSEKRTQKWIKEELKCYIMVLKPVIMNYGTTEINFEKESERDRDFYTIKQYTIYLLKSYNPPMKKIYKSKKSVTLQNNNYMTWLEYNS